jgi:glycosyltransferase involved in cell wall biosynthesis
MIIILEKFSGKVKIIQAAQKGAAAARNLAYAHANGDYIIFFDSDDLIDPGYLSSQIKKCLQSPGSVVVSKWGRFYNDDVNSYKEDKNIIKSDLSFYEWVVQYWTYNKHTTPPGRVIIPKEIIETAGLWNESLSLNDDLDFYTRIFSCARKIIYNDEAHFYYRSGINGLSSKTKGYTYQLSNFNSLNEATGRALSIYRKDRSIQKACANMWQLFVYENYPRNKDLVNKAKTMIKELGGSDFEFPCGGLTRNISNLLGWKTTKYIKLLLSN